MTDQGREKPTERVVRQRVRNRVIEHLEALSSFEAQVAYDVAVPIVYVPYELLAGWEDFVRQDPAHDPEPLDTYSPDEVDELARVHRALDTAADAVGDDYPTLAEVQTIPEWAALRDAALQALTVFGRRGRMSEDREEF